MDGRHNKAIGILCRIEKQKQENFLQKQRLLSKKILLLEEEKKMLKKHLHAEASLSSGIIFHKTFHHFKKVCEEKISVLCEESQSFEREYSLVQKELDALYRKIKKYELIMDRQKEGERRQMQKKEQENFDEIASVRFLL